MEASFEFEHGGRRFTVHSERQPDRGLHDLYYRGHFVETHLSAREAAQAEIIAHFVAWLAENPVPPYECHGGPLDGELMEERGPEFVPPNVVLGRYRRSGDDYEWEV